MATEYFIWPKASYSLKETFLSRRKTIEDVERTLFDLFNNQQNDEAYPVLISSGRAAISIVMQAEGLGRNDLVQIFPFASHCVIEAIGTYAMPVLANQYLGLEQQAEPPSKIKAQLIHHQLGFVQEQTTHLKIIEDAVDTLLIPGGPLFPLNGQYEIWSLPKILGTVGGCVLWCKSEEGANKIRQIRDSRKSNNSLRWGLRYLSVHFPSLYPIWSGSESWQGAIPNWALKDLAEKIEKWEDIVTVRQQSFKLLSEFIPDWLKSEGLKPERLKRDQFRLPTAIPAEVNMAKAAKLVELGFSHGCRHFERYQMDKPNELVKLFPIPIHQDVPLTVLKQAKSILTDE